MEQLYQTNARGSENTAEKWDDKDVGAKGLEGSTASVFWTLHDNNIHELTVTMVT